jgi:DNA-binding transcriptional regulator YhcF (GntR family)
MFKYEEISRDIEYLVLNGTLQAGDKIPSVRKISSQYGVSVSTVLSAYIDLEKKGFIQGKERSGYFARLPASRKSDPPESPREIRISRDVTPARLIRQF